MARSRGATDRRTAAAAARPSFLAWLLPGPGQLIWILAFTAALAVGPLMMNADGDLGRHITIGNRILSSGSIPVHDVFSFTRYGDALTPHEWLAQVALAASHRVLGLDGPVMLTALLIALTFALVFRRVKRSGALLLTGGAVTVLALFTSSIHWLTRPHVFTFLFMALWLDTLDAIRREPRRAWWRLPLIMLLWANVHGAFIAGFMTLLLYGIGVAWDRFWEPRATAPLPRGYAFWLLVGAATALAASLINPAGIELWRTSVGYLGNDFLVNHTREYLSPDFHNVRVWPFAAMAGLFFLLLGTARRRIGTEHVLLAGAWLLMALYSVRNVPLFAIVAAAPLARLASDWIEAHRRRTVVNEWWVRIEHRLRATDGTLRGVVWPLAVLAFLLLFYRGGATLAFGGTRNAFDARFFPVAAVEWMERERIEGNGFNFFPWGGYLLYRTWPERRVFIDGQTDFYGEELTREYGRVLAAASGWQDVLAAYDVSWVLVPPGEPVAAALHTSRDWRPVYEDGTAVLFTAVPR
ncbi:MAG TPA: hypothetical protein VFZ69_14080 [Longimicrobiales bacterium]